MKLTKEMKARIQDILVQSDPYKVLAVPPGVTMYELKLAHRALAAFLHPDRWAGVPTLNVGEAMARVNVAYDTLLDPEKRKRYDALNKVDYPKCPKCKGTGAVYMQKGFTKKVRLDCPACGGTGRG